MEKINNCPRNSKRSLMRPALACVFWAAGLAAVAAILSCVVPVVTVDRIVGKPLMRHDGQKGIPGPPIQVLDFSGGNEGEARHRIAELGGGERAVWRLNRYVLSSSMIAGHKQGALGLLSRCGTPGLPVLVDLLRSRDMAIRRGVGLAVCELREYDGTGCNMLYPESAHTIPESVLPEHWQAAVAKMKMHLDTERDPDVRLFLSHTLSALSGDYTYIINEMEKSLLDAREETQLYILAHVIVRSIDSELVGVLGELAARSPNIWVAKAALLVLMAQAHPSAETKERLAGLLEHGNPRVREEALYFISQSIKNGEPDFLGIGVRLEALLGTETDPGVRDKMAETIHALEGRGMRR